MRQTGLRSLPHSCQHAIHLCQFDGIGVETGQGVAGHLPGRTQKGQGLHPCLGVQDRKK